MWVLESASPASRKTAATFIDSIRPNNQPEKNKAFRIDIQLLIKESDVIRCIIQIMTKTCIFLYNLIELSTLMMILGARNDSGWQCYQSWESHFSIAYFDLKILLFLVNTLITKFDDFISN